MKTFLDSILFTIDSYKSVNEVKFVSIGVDNIQISFDDFASWAKLQDYEDAKSIVVPMFIVFNDNSWLEWTDITEEYMCYLNHEFQYHKVVDGHDKVHLNDTEINYIIKNF